VDGRGFHIILAKFLNKEKTMRKNFIIATLIGASIIGMSACSKGEEGQPPADDTTAATTSSSLTAAPIDQNSTQQTTATQASSDNSSVNNNQNNVNGNSQQIAAGSDAQTIQVPAMNNNANSANPATPDMNSAMNSAANAPVNADPNTQSTTTQ